MTCRMCSICTNPDAAWLREKRRHIQSFPTPQGCTRSRPDSTMFCLAPALTLPRRLVERQANLPLFVRKCRSVASDRDRQRNICSKRMENTKGRNAFPNIRDWKDLPDGELKKRCRHVGKLYSKCRSVSSCSEDDARSIENLLHKKPSWGQKFRLVTRRELKKIIRLYFRTIMTRSALELQAEYQGIVKFMRYLINFN